MASVVGFEMDVLTTRGYERCLCTFHVHTRLQVCKGRLRRLRVGCWLYGRLHCACALALMMGNCALAHGRTSTAACMARGWQLHYLEGISLGWRIMGILATR